MAEQLKPWDTSKGMIDDIDGYIKNGLFGHNDDYSAAIEDPAAKEGLQYIADIVNAEGEELGRIMLSLGKGWVTSDAGKTVTHPARTNIVTSSRYGTFVNKITQELRVDMTKFGESPLSAEVWEGLGFHWNLIPLPTMKKKPGTNEYETKDVLMPTSFLGSIKTAAKGAGKAAGKGKSSEIAIDPKLDKNLTELAQNLDRDEFIGEAIKAASAAKAKTLIPHLLDEGPNGYYQTHKSK